MKDELQRWAVVVPRINSHQSVLLNLSLAQLFTVLGTLLAVCFILFSSEINEDKKKGPVVLDK